MDGGVMDADLREDTGNFVQRGGELRVFCGVFRGEARDAAGGLGVIVIKKQRVAGSERGREDARVGAQNFAIEFFDGQVASHVFAQRAERVRQRRGAKAGMKFFGDGAAADNFAAFEHQGLNPPLAR